MNKIMKYPSLVVVELLLLVRVPCSPPGGLLPGSAVIFGICSFIVMADMQAYMAGGGVALVQGIKYLSIHKDKNKLLQQTILQWFCHTVVKTTCLLGSTVLSCGPLEVFLLGLWSSLLDRQTSLS